MIAEATAREIGRLSLVEALGLTALIALKEPHRHSRIGARWLQRYLDEHPAPTLGEAAFATTLLTALGTDAHAEALPALRAMAERAISRGRSRDLA
jgi:hypothetical protein